MSSDVKSLQRAIRGHLEEISAIKQELTRHESCANRLRQARPSDAEASQKAAQLCADILANVKTEFGRILPKVGQLFTVQLPVATTGWARRFDDFDEQLRVIKNVDESAVKATRERTLRRFDELASQWKGLTKCIKNAAADIQRELAHFPSLSGAAGEMLAAMRPAIEECLAATAALSLKEARQLLRARRFLLLEHPGPLVRRDKRGVILLGSLDGSTTAMERTVISLYESPEGHETSTSPPSSPASATSGASSSALPPPHFHREKLDFQPELDDDSPGVFRLHFNGGEDPMKIRDAKRSQGRGASLKLYQLRFGLKLTVSDAAVEEDFYEEVVLETRPFGIISNTSQEAEPWCALFWRRFFGHKDRNVEWTNFFSSFSQFFEEETGRGLDGGVGVNHVSAARIVNGRCLSGQEARVYETLVGKGEIAVVSRSWLLDPAFGTLDEFDANYNANKKTNPFSRWKYLYSFLDLLKEKYGEAGHERKILLLLWQQGVILGFVNANQWRDPKKKGNFLIRFGNSQPARIIVTYWMRVEAKSTGAVETRIVNYFFTKRSFKEKMTSPIERILGECLPKKGDGKDYVLKEDFRGVLIHLNGLDLSAVIYRDVEERLRNYLGEDRGTQLVCSGGYVTGVSSNEQLWPALAEHMARMNIPMDLEEEEYKEEVEKTEENAVMAIQAMEIGGAPTSLGESERETGITSHELAYDANDIIFVCDETISQSAFYQVVQTSPRDMGASVSSSLMPMLAGDQLQFAAPVLQEVEHQPTTGDSLSNLNTFLQPPNQSNTLNTPENPEIHNEPFFTDEGGVRE